MAQKEKKEHKPRCFVISPIGDPNSQSRRHADIVLNYIIKPALPDFEVRRADEFSAPEMISDKVIEAILDDELAIADLTFVNPNVFYELGLRHMIEKPVIQIAPEGMKLPFDNQGVGTIFFDSGLYQSHQNARELIRKAASIVMGEKYKVSNPVTQARGSIRLKESSDTTEMMLSQIMKRMSDLEQGQRTSEKVAQIRASLASDVLSVNALTRPIAGSSSMGLLSGIEPMTLSKLFTQPSRAFPDIYSSAQEPSGLWVQSQAEVKKDEGEKK